MATPWRIVDSVDTDEGLLDLRQRGETDFLITIEGRVLMNSSANMSEIVLAQLACESLKNKKNPRVLVGGLGMGFTLKAGGVFAVWSEDPDKAFEKRLKAAGFSVNRQRPGRGGRRHVVYIARKWIVA
jgi:hypothetical protein